MGSAAAGFKENRKRYQSNDYNKDLGLNWMDFQARQYDPQLGRFLGVDPLASSGGQDKFSPYAAMANMPESYIDPSGEEFFLHSPHQEGMTMLAKLGAMYGLSFNWDERSGKVTIKGDLQKDGQTGTQIGMALGSNGATGAFAKGFGDATKEWFKEMVGSKSVTIHGVITNNSTLLFSENFGATDNGHLSVMQDLVNGTSLSNRPDFDGRLTLNEANTWYREGRGAPLYTNLSLIRLTFLHPEDFTKKGTNYFNLLAGNADDGLVYGNIGLKYLGNYKVKASFDIYDFDIKPWTLKNTPRNIETEIGLKNAGEGTPYRILFYGLGTISPGWKPTRAWELGF